MRSFKTFLAEQRKYTDRPQAQLQAPGSGQMPKELGAGGTGGGSPAPRAVRRPFETIRRGAGRVLNFPFNLLPKRRGARTALRGLATSGVVGAGVYDSLDTLQKDVNTHLSQSGYADVQLNKDQALKAWRDLSTKDQTALAGSLNAFRDYYLPAAGTGAAALAARNPLVAAVPTVIDRATSLATGTESKPMLDARRAVAGQVMRPFSATSVFSGENPSAAQAGYNFISNVEDMAKGIRTRQQGIRQNVLYPGRGPESEPAQTGITVDLDSTSTRRTPRTNR